VTAAAPIEVPVAVAAAVLPPMAVETLQTRVEPVIEARVEPVMETRAAPVVEARTQSVAAPVSAAPPPQVDLDTALRESGLLMVTTKADRVAPQPEAEEPSAPRQRRERRPPPADLNAPLMQVETRNKGDADAPPQ
jgi:hypothetical protein